MFFEKSDLTERRAKETHVQLWTTESNKTFSLWLKSKSYMDNDVYSFFHIKIYQCNKDQNKKTLCCDVAE